MPSTILEQKEQLSSTPTLSPHMPVIHSSPHPNNDVRLREDLLEDDMPGNPYPNPNVRSGGVEPGYDADQWAPASGHSAAGRGFYPGSGRGTMPYDDQAPPLAAGRRGFEREHSPSYRHSHHPHAVRREENISPYPMEERYPRVSFAGRPHGRPSFARSHFEHEEDEEDEEDEGEWSDEDFDGPYDEDEPDFFPPKMGRGRAWDSSDGEDFDREFDYEDEEELEDEEEEFEDAFAAPGGRFRGGMMPRRGQPHRHQGPMRRSGPPPLETPPDSPPPLSRGMPPRRGMDPRMMRGRRMDSPIMNRGGMRLIPVQGGPPLSRGMPRRQQSVMKKRTRFADSPSSLTSGGSWGVPGFQRPPGSRRPSRSGGSIKKAMNWLTKPGATLHPILRAGTLIRPVELTWDVSYPPSAVRAGRSPGIGVASFSEPATSPPVQFMRLIIHIPGLDGAQWMVDVWPFGSPYATANQLPPSPYSFVGSPSAFARTGPLSPFPIDPHVPIVRCADVLHAVYRMLRRRAVADDFWALDARRRERVSKAFWARCRGLGAEAAAQERDLGVRRGMEREGMPSPGQEEMNRQVQSGVKRIDFMEGRTRWEGLEWRDTDEWIVKLGRT